MSKPYIPVTVKSSKDLSSSKKKKGGASGLDVLKSLGKKRKDESHSRVEYSTGKTHAELGNRIHRELSKVARGEQPGTLHTLTKTALAVLEINANLKLIDADFPVGGNRHNSVTGIDLVTVDTSKNRPLYIEVKVWCFFFFPSFFFLAFANFLTFMKTRKTGGAHHDELTKSGGNMGGMLEELEIPNCIHNKVFFCLHISIFFGLCLIFVLCVVVFTSYSLQTPLGRDAWTKNKARRTCNSGHFQRIGC